MDNKLFFCFSHIPYEGSNASALIEAYSEDDALAKFKVLYKDVINDDILDWYDVRAQEVSMINGSWFTTYPLE